MKEWKPLILIVEDSECMAVVTAGLLEEQGYDTVTAYNATEARTLVQHHTPDLMILDVMLPDGNGFALCEEFRQKTDTPILFLTGATETESKVTGLGIGGDYYMTKPYDHNEFIAVVKSLIRRETQTRSKIAGVFNIERGPLTINVHDGKVFVNGKDAELSHMEYAVLLMLVENEDKELTYDTLYEGVWNMPMYHNSNALRQQISRLKKKLGEEDTDAFSILNKSGKGYTFTQT
jgi:DNA-binding response OmpR family regulator